MTCAELHDFYELYALSLLDPPERAELQEHLARGCPVCSEGVRRAIETNAIILAGAPQLNPPRRLRRRILAAVGARERSWTQVLQWALVGLFAVLWVTTLYRSDQQNRRLQAELRQVERILAFLREPETRHVVFGQGQPQPPAGSIFVHRNQGVLVIVKRLAPVGPDKTYELWTIPKGGPPKPAGLFQPDETGTAIVVSPGPVDVNNLAAVAVSVEPQGGSPAPTTTPIVVAPLSE